MKKLVKAAATGHEGMFDLFDADAGESPIFVELNADEIEGFWEKYVRDCAEEGRYESKVAADERACNEQAEDEAERRESGIW